MIVVSGATGNIGLVIIRQLSTQGVPLRPPFFMQNMLRSAPTIAAQNELAAPMKDGRIAMVSAARSFDQFARGHAAWFVVDN
jgi:uncharacterized protein YbjT (DUF2867 family)